MHFNPNFQFSNFQISTKFTTFATGNIYHAVYLSPNTMGLVTAKRARTGSKYIQKRAKYDKQHSYTKL